jgi:hypothetical protein
VTLTGKMGIGKTHLAKEVSYILNSRNYFMNGNYYFDLKNVKTSEQLKNLIKSENWDYMNKNVLLIFDNIENLYEHHKVQFRWWILDLASRFKATFLLISRVNITDYFNEVNILTAKNWDLEPLNEYESADMLIAICKRMISVDDLYQDEDEINLHQALQLEPNLRNCCGIPAYIIILADLLQYNSFDTIDIRKQIKKHVKSLIYK